MKISITIDGLSASEAHDLLGTARQIEQADTQRSDADQQAAYEHETGRGLDVVDQILRDQAIGTHETSGTSLAPSEEKPNETVDDTPASRRRRRPPVDTGGESSPARATVSGGNDETPSEAGVQPAADPTPKLRRKRATKAEMVERRAREAAEAALDDGGEDDSMGDGRRITGENQDSAESLTDADMSKAASEGARVIGPEAVTAILSEFGVGSVNELPQERRQEFVDNVDAAKAKAAKES